MSADAWEASRSDALRDIRIVAIEALKAWGRPAALVKANSLEAEVDREEKAGKIVFKLLNRLGDDAKDATHALM